ncbi:protein phosphatase 2C domain-containing protein [uncultured Vagococcus sp.]|uniref:protein phosphatase 2C domain-containing protein n=1 Tax=uncultured Vagococcus sp. TaxID=189676 RepID=UPI0028D522E2|nr:protein phosphatase 2C domain-containing protein [uncultured Vagococcus sp.]
MIEFTSKSVQGNEQNEDWVIATPIFGLVIDGASGLYSGKVTHYASDAQWFSHRLGKLLTARLNDLSKPIASHVKAACDCLLEEYRELLARKKGDYDLDKLPNATLSVVRFNEFTNQLELFQLGDSPILIEERGQLMILDDENLGKSDQHALNRMLAIAEEKQISPKEARPFVNKLLKQNRRKRNSSEGYWILDPTAQGIEGARQFTLPLNQITRVAVMSDGLWEAYDILRLYSSPQDLFERLFSSELDEILEEIRTIQKSDPLFEQYPRFKLMDDASVLIYTIDMI